MEHYIPGNADIRCTLHFLLSGRSKGKQDWMVQACEILGLVLLAALHAK
jgi:hypothetical protein